MERTAELASKLSIEEKLFYTNRDLKQMAWSYARYMLSNQEATYLGTVTTLQTRG